MLHRSVEVCRDIVVPFLVVVYNHIVVYRCTELNCFFASKSPQTLVQDSQSRGQLQIASEKSQAPPWKLAIEVDDTKALYHQRCCFLSPSFGWNWRSGGHRSTCGIGSFGSDMFPFSAASRHGKLGAARYFQIF